MPIYIVINKETNAEVSRYSAMGVVEGSWPLSAHDHIEYVEPVVVAPVPEKRITRLALRSRFTSAEKVALEIASLDNPAATMQERGGAAALRAYMADVASATFIDLNRPDTRAGIQQLEVFGLLAPGRALVILDTEPTADEVFNG